MYPLIFPLVHMYTHIYIYSFIYFANMQIYIHYITLHYNTLHYHTIPDHTKTYHNTIPYHYVHIYIYKYIIYAKIFKHECTLYIYIDIYIYIYIQNHISVYLCAWHLPLDPLSFLTLKITTCFTSTFDLTPRPACPGLND